MSQQQGAGGSAGAGAHEDGYSSESPDINIGGLQGGYGEQQDSHGDASADSNNYQRSMFPGSSFAREENNEDEGDVEQDEDDSTERDEKSIIPREDDDVEPDQHVRVHKDIIPHPEDFGY